MTARRVSTFVVIGLAGFVVQMSAAAAFLAAGVPAVVATVLAIEAAIVSNHAWHRRWAWRDRAARHAWPVTLLRAHLGAGGTSLVVGAGAVALLSHRIPPLLAQILAVGACAGVNYWLTDRWIFRAHPRAARIERVGENGLQQVGTHVPRARYQPSPLATPRHSWNATRGSGATAFAILGLLVAAEGKARANGPSAAALDSWQRYGAAVERARAVDDLKSVPAWATDDDRRGTGVRAAIARGELHVTHRSVANVDVNDATLEHWQGSVLLEGVTLAQIGERLRHPQRFPQPADVLALDVTGRTDAGHDLYLRLTRTMLVSATFDTWHRVRHHTRGPARVDSTSLATRIEEVQQAGTPSERRVRLEDSRDLLWRMQSFWRFTAVPEGVIVTCESVTLSRPVPMGLGLVSRPIIARVARESMTTALRAWERGWHSNGRSD